MIHTEAWYMEANEDEALFENEWVTVRETSDGWVYVDTPPAVAVLPFKRDPDSEKMRFLVRKEMIPTMGEGLQQWLVFGGVQEHGSPEEAAVAELLEEGGFKVSTEDLIDLGEVWTRKDAAHPLKLFAVDVSELEQTTPEGDGSEGEKDFELEWIDWYGITDHPAAVLHSMAIRLYKRFYL